MVFRGGECMDKEQIEKVKKGLECCTRSHQTIRQNLCDECPYKNKGVMNAFTVWKTCTNALAEDALKLINELQATAEPKWIPVSERMPKYDHYGQEYWVITQWRYPDGRVSDRRVQQLRWERTTVRGKTVERFKTLWDAIVHDEIIAWMPVIAPEPPKEGE